MTTRSGARVYRGAPRQRVDPDACLCGRVGIGLTSTGRRKAHRDQDGVDCPGSGVKVTPDAGVGAHVVALGLAEAERLVNTNPRWEGRDRQQPANRWSGKA